MTGRSKNSRKCIEQISKSVNIVIVKELETVTLLNIYVALSVQYYQKYEHIVCVLSPLLASYFHFGISATRDWMHTTYSLTERHLYSQAEGSANARRWCTIKPATTPSPAFLHSLPPLSIPV